MTEGNRKEMSQQHLGLARDALAEDAHQPAVPAHPDRPAQVLRRYRIVRLVDLDVTVAMDDALAFREARKPLQGQPLQGPTLYLGEQLGDLPPRGAVDPRVGHCLFPVHQEVILLVEAGEQ